MKCQKCGSELRYGAKFCDNCGAAVLIKKQCPKCGRIIDGNAIYCPFCNSSILEKEAPKSKLADVEGLKNDFIKCPKCGNEYKATTPYCPTCGEKTSQPVHNDAPSAEKVSEEHLKNYIEFKKCPNCSEINDSKALFCKKCNYNLSNTPISTKDKKNNLRLIASIGLIVAIVIILILVIVELNKPKDNKTPNKESKSYSSLYEDPTTKKEYTQPVTEKPTTEKPTEPQTTEKPTEELTEVQTTVEETEPVTTETISIDDLVFSDDKVNVFYTGYDVDSDGDYRIHMRVENNSNTDWEFVLMDTSIDNYVIDPIFRVTVPSGKNANEDIYIFSSTLTKNNLNKINTIEFKIHYFDTINQIGDKESYTSDSILIKI